MATLAQFTSQPVIEAANLSVANTGRTGSGTIVTVASGPIATAAIGVGKMITQIIIQATATTTAGMIRFFVSTNAGSVWNLLTEVAVTAATPTATVTAFTTTVPALTGLVLPGGNGTTAQCLLGAATNNAEAFNVIVTSGTF